MVKKVLFGRSKQVIEDFLEYISERAEKTWDIENLKSSYGNLFPVFIYDSLMVSHPDHYLLKDFKYFGPAVTMDDEFLVLRNKKDRVAFLESGEVKTHTSVIPKDFKRVKGELYGVPLDMIFYLDRPYDNGGTFDRVETTIRLDQKNLPVVSNVLMYVGAISFWKSKINLVHDRMIISPYEFDGITLSSVYCNPIR